MDFRNQIADALLSIDSAAEYLGVTPRTIYQYLKYGAPVMARRALAARAGTLNHWSGYRIIDQRLIRADGRVFTRRDLDWFEHRYEIQDREALPHTPARRVAEVRAEMLPEPLTTSVVFFASINPAHRKQW